MMLQEAVLLRVHIWGLQDAHSCGISFMLHMRLPEISGKKREVWCLGGAVSIAGLVYPLHVTANKQLTISK